MGLEPGDVIGWQPGQPRQPPPCLLLNILKETSLYLRDH